jgi:hypothetical protein
MKQLIWISLTYALAAPAFAAPASQAQPAPANGDKVICKATSISGSLARPKRVCLTKADWEQMRRDAKEYGRERIDGCGARNADPSEPGMPPAPTC